MTDTITNVTQVNEPVRRASLQAVSAEAPAAVLVATSSPAASSSTDIPSRYTRYDPLAGLVTTYLNSQGSVNEQFPSTTVVAYLRAGLTASGESRVGVTTTSSV